MSVINNTVTVEEGWLECPLEEVWSKARLWGEAQGYSYVESYGVIDVAPT